MSIQNKIYKIKCSPQSATLFSAMFSPEAKEVVANLMHAFGDVENPREDTVSCMCGMVSIFLDNVLLKAVQVALVKGFFDEECLLFACKDNLLMYNAAKSKLERKKALEEVIKKSH